MIKSIKIVKYLILNLVINKKPNLSIIIPNIFLLLYCNNYFASTKKLIERENSLNKKSISFVLVGGVNRKVFNFKFH